MGSTMSAMMELALAYVTLGNASMVVAAVLVLCTVCYAIGIFGATSPLAIKRLARLMSTGKKDEAQKAEVAKPKDKAEAGAEAATLCETSTGSSADAQQEKSGARKRASSPAPARTTAHAGA